MNIPDGAPHLPVLPPQVELGTLFGAALDAVVAIDTEGRITAWNPRAETTFGWSAPEVIGRPLVEIIIPPQHRAAHLQGVSRFLHTGEARIANRRIETTALCRDGREIPIELAITPVPVESGWLVVAFIRDLTEHRESEAALHAARAQLEHLVSRSAAVIYRRPLSGAASRILWISDNLTQLTGHGLAEALESAWWASHVHVEDLPRVEQALEQAGPDGQFSAEYRFRHQDGRYRWLFDQARVQPDADGRPGELIGTWLDVSDRKQLQLRLEQAQKMEAVGMLAGGIAHDFNNLLTAIVGNADLLLAQFSMSDDRRVEAEEILAAARRGGRLTQQLLAFSRQQVRKPTVLDLGEVIRATERMLQRLVGEDIELACRFEDGLGQIEADVSQVEQIVLNLVLNARDAMPDGGRITITASNAEFDDEFARSHPPARVGRYVMLSVSDTGQGMPPEVQARIFDPFFTTKETGKGTGLGLATVYGIVKQNDGFIWVYSEPGEGATFKVYLPRFGGVPQPAAGEALGAPGRTGSETVLLVEDEAQVRQVTRRQLQLLGYTVLEASRAEEALEVAARHPGPIHLLLTDVVLPGLRGPALAEQLQATRPTIRVLLISGYLGHSVARMGLVPERFSLLSKPFNAAALAAQVREVLDGDPDSSRPNA